MLIEWQQIPCSAWEDTVPENKGFVYKHWAWRLRHIPLALIFYNILSDQSSYTVVFLPVVFFCAVWEVRLFIQHSESCEETEKGGNMGDYLEWSLCGLEIKRSWVVSSGIFLWMLRWMHLLSYLMRTSSKVILFGRHLGTRLVGKNDFSHEGSGARSCFCFHDDVQMDPDGLLAKNIQEENL